MQKLPTKLEGPLLLAPVVHGDERGFFLESYRRSALEELGIDGELIQDNHSRSRRGIVRGMHFQPGQAKLVRCVRGAILDVIVDIRRGSPQFGASGRRSRSTTSSTISSTFPTASPTASACSASWPT